MSLRAPTDPVDPKASCYAVGFVDDLQSATAHGPTHPSTAAKPVFEKPNPMLEG